MSDKKTKDQIPEQLKVVKVQPYPFDCTFIIKEGAPPIHAKVSKITEIGFLIKSVGHLYRVGDNLQCQLALPGEYGTLNEPVKVIKTYEAIEAYTPQGNRERVLVVEMHFKNISKEKKLIIKKFTNAIGQKG